MTLEKFGRTLLFMLFLLIFVVGAIKALRIADPYIRRVSASFADAIQI